MGTIVTLPPPRRRRREAAQTSDEATILLFMGVRYERELEPEVAEDRAQGFVAHLHVPRLESA